MKLLLETDQTDILYLKNSYFSLQDSDSTPKGEETRHTFICSINRNRKGPNKTAKAI